MRISFLASILAFSLVASARTTPVLTHNESPAGQLPSRSAAASLHVSLDGSRVAYAVKRDWQIAPIIDGVESKRRYDWIVAGRIRFTPDNRRTVFAIKKGSKTSVVIDQTEGPLFDSVDDPVFSPTTNHVAYAGKRGRSYVAVLNGVEHHTPYDDVRFLALSDSSRLAYAASRNGKVSCVVDGVEGRWYDEVTDVRITPDGQIAACRARLNGFWTLVVNGAESEWYEEVTPPILSGKRHAFSALRKGKRLFVVDGRESPEYAPRAFAPPAFSPDAKHVAHSATDDWQESIVLDGTAGPVHGGAFLSHHFSPDGSKLASILARRQDVHCIVLDNVVQKSYDKIHRLLFSPDGSKLAFLAQRGPRMLVVLDGVEFHPSDSIEPWSLAFSPDGLHLAWIARDAGESRLIVDGHKGNAYHSILPQDRLAFDASNTLHFIALQSLATTDHQQILRVSVRID